MSQTDQSFVKASTEEDADQVEVYLLFSNNILSLFEDVVKKLENDSTTCVELYSIMSTEVGPWER